MTAIVRKIDGYVIDCILSEEASTDDTITAYPMEDGANVADHVQLGPLMIELSLVVSDTPIGPAAQERRAGVVPSSEARDFIRALRAERRPFTYEGSTGTYERMMFTRIGEPRDSSTGAELVLDVTLGQVEIAQVRREVVRDLGHRTSRTVDAALGFLCPDLTVILDDPAANVSRQCRRVLQRAGGDLYFADTGASLTPQERVDFYGQQGMRRGGGALDGSGNVADQSRLPSKLAYDPKQGGVAVRRSPAINGGRINVVSRPVTAAERAQLETQERTRWQTNELVRRATGYDRLFEGR